MFCKSTMEIRVQTSRAEDAIPLAKAPNLPCCLVIFMTSKYFADSLCDITAIIEVKFLKKLGRLTVELSC